MDTETVRAFAANWPWLVLAVIIVWPALHFLYGNRIAALKEDLERLKARSEEQIAETTSRHHAADFASVRELEEAAGDIPDDSTVSRTVHPSDDHSRSSLLPRRPVLDASTAAEIRAAYDALPPLERKEGIRAAYAGKRIGGTGEIRKIWMGAAHIFVMIDTEGGDTFILTFGEECKRDLDPLREGMRAHFEGEIESADRLSVDLRNGSISPESRHRAI